MDRGGGQAAVHRVTKSRSRLRQLGSSSRALGRVPCAHRRVSSLTSTFIVTIILMNDVAIYSEKTHIREFSVSLISLFLSF